MPVDRQVRRTAARLEQAAQQIGADISQVLTRQQRVQAVLAENRIVPMPDPPKGQRYVTLEEMRVEFTDPLTTPARRQTLLAIRCELLPPETVLLPVVVAGP